jgi:hypothetical protein
MSAEELARLMDTWSDALNVAELLGSPFLRVTRDWDLRDWQAVDLPDGIRFQRFDTHGRITEAVVVMSAPVPQATMRIDGPVPTWLVHVAAAERGLPIANPAFLPAF